jgi:uncharacterized protein YrrD
VYVDKKNILNCALVEDLDESSKASDGKCFTKLPCVAFLVQRFSIVTAYVCGGFFCALAITSTLEFFRKGYQCCFILFVTSYYPPVKLSRQTNY